MTNNTCCWSTQQQSQPHTEHLCAATQSTMAAQLGIGIQETNAGIGIPASIISVRHRTKKLPDCLGLIRYRTCPGIVSFFYSGTGLIGCRTVRHSGIYTHEHALAHAHTPMMCSMNMDRIMDVQHGHEAWTWTCTMDMEMEKHHGCRNADKQFSPASLVFRQFITLSPHRHSGIVVSLVLLVTDQSVSAQLCMAEICIFDRSK